MGDLICQATGQGDGRTDADGGVKEDGQGGPIASTHACIP